DALAIGTTSTTTTYNFDVLSAGEILDNLSALTEELVTNPGAERALLAALTRAQTFADAGNPFMAYISMLQYVMLLNRFDRTGIVSDDAAQQLYALALDATRAILTPPAPPSTPK
ncbi:MAG TPA: hypothetical protein VFV93_07455, partial [Thermomicrobiales bacterium]|nr:hypothetical protein [Thermomicrobiales bacterium]